MNKPKSINALLHQKNSLLKRISSHTSNLQIFERRLRGMLPEEIAHSLLWQIANRTGETLTLLIEHAGWATRMRFMQKELLKYVQRIAPEIQTIQLKLKPQSRAIPSRAAPPRTISQHSSDQLIAFAQCIDDQQLRQAIERLGKHRQQPKKTTKPMR
jgi:hypothetical protein